ncbi:MAG: metallothiol transferase FosB [Shouchella clausii]|jgi:metallothiol transferase
MVNGINHMTFSVSNMDKAVSFYKHVFMKAPLVLGEKTAYFTIGGIWLALNLQPDIDRNEIRQSYTHIAFSIEESQLDAFYTRLLEAGADILPGRKRQVETEGKSIYFRDPDGHLLEVHTGTLAERLAHYAKTAPDMLVNIDNQNKK